MFKIIKTHSPQSTKKIGFNLARNVAKTAPGKKALVFALVGELGSGKTTFLQGFAKGLGINETILSPTFIIFKKFALRNSRFKNFYHFDCYRILKPKDILALGFKEIISSPQNIIVIEWAERVRRIIPKDALWIEFRWRGEFKREIRIQTKRASA